MTFFLENVDNRPTAKEEIIRFWWCSKFQRALDLPKSSAFNQSNLPYVTLYYYHLYIRYCGCKQQYMDEWGA